VRLWTYNLPWKLNANHDSKAGKPNIPAGYMKEATLREKPGFILSRELKDLDDEVAHTFLGGNY